MSFTLKSVFVRYSSTAILVMVGVMYIVFLSEMLGRVDAHTPADQLTTPQSSHDFFNTVFLPTHTPTATPTSTPTPTPTPVVLPSSISIPALQIVQSPLEYLGTDSDGSMQTPHNPLAVGWLHIGPKPGEVGNSIFTAHYDDAQGRPAAFYYLKNIAIGDEITITLVDGSPRTFHVDFVGELDAYDGNVGAITRQTDYPSITLVTCHGSWDMRSGMYSRRLVVYAK
ncbi:MAG: class F sortase [bacterium]